MKTISKDELATKMGDGRVIVVNVLKGQAYEKIHIKGSLSIPRMELENGRWQELDRGKQVVVHCSSYSCGASKLAAEFLESKGFDARAYEGGMKEWAEGGMPTEGMISAKQYLEERLANLTSVTPRPGQESGQTQS